jgi:hypothetical protein
MLPARWPKWMLFFVAVALVVVLIGLTMLLEPIGRALAPTVTPEPTLPIVQYARPISGECENCHLDKQALAASAAPSEDVETYYIEPSSLETPHGSLGCITCHGGHGDIQDKEAAHEGLIPDLSATHPEDCLLCHRDLPAQFPDDHLRTPHGEVSNAAWEGSACGVLCSDCHGEVGHGFDPVTGETICPMSVCLDCHQERNLEARLSECNTCHLGPHDVADTTLCKECHVSTDTWQEVAVTDHPLDLSGQHATTDCFSCHKWPDFRGLDGVCSDCHSRPHELGNDDCALCHTPEGWLTSADVLMAAATGFPHPAAGREDCRSCHGVEGAQAIPADHKGRTNDTCQVCHEPAPAPAILHPVEDRGSCLTCHGEDHPAEFPLTTHSDYDEASCLTCHEPAGVVPLPVEHSLEGRADCLMCHSPVSLKPAPDSHGGWGNELCLLCHESSETPTKTEHRFPQDHQTAAENCVFCHPDQDFTTYTCNTCHAASGIEEIHGALGIADINNKCVLCHPDGKQ